MLPDCRERIFTPRFLTELETSPDSLFMAVSSLTWLSPEGTVLFLLCSPYSSVWAKKTPRVGYHWWVSDMTAKTPFPSWWENEAARPGIPSVDEAWGPYLLPCLSHSRWTGFRAVGTLSIPSALARLLRCAPSTVFFPCGFTHSPQGTDTRDLFFDVMS